MKRGRVSSALPLAALAALIVPVCAGIGWMAWAGAPQSYRLVNAGALAVACVWIVFARAPSRETGWRWLGLAALILLTLPFGTGPSLSGVVRWIDLEVVTLHSGFVAIPALVVAATQDRRWGAWLLMGALLPLTFQPDAAAGLAVTFAAAGIHDRTRDWRFGLVAVFGFFLTLSMAFRGELPPQPFVERVLHQALGDQPLFALVLLASLGVAVLAIAKGAGSSPPARYGLAGALFGFFVMALVSHYPYPLIGYGAASILGCGLGLGLANAVPRPSRQDALAD